ncbi:endonuclease/exonuclease/phosphatase family protein [Nocardioides KLBMP 9356]|uniref:Endonuclease/exonuclease/phosphatase family protein n=1 Tax=Nocardioides potassii TaxID=2911371 RepID=A0ABS9HI53_9ACTN|nr:endonuclease/exonuclease/phosphatase family protein [Nocardioides potassii]MCF6379806.1 endonuclease/exonuclease/phosphatase family protein [Nocardioides potassii]
MNPNQRPTRPRALPVPRVAVAVVVAVLVGLLAVAATWAVTDDGDATSGTAPEAQGQPTGAYDGSGTDASDDDGDGGTTDDEGTGDDGGTTGAKGDRGSGSGTAGANRDEKLEKSVRRFRAAQRRLAQRVAKQLTRRMATVELNVASFNVLGASHTGAGGNKPAYYPDASARMNMAIGVLRSQAIDVVGFQEFEASQYGMFAARAGEYSLYPGLSLGDKSVRFNIAWRSSAFQLVEAHTLSIPYAGGSRIEMPVVLLESTTTGRRAWFANFHNPADTPSLGNNARWRAEAAGIEIAHLTALHQQDGTPVIVTGDFNERAEIFCRFTASGVFAAAAGGSGVGGCAPPPSMQVDWIFGSSGVTFDSYGVIPTGRASDHSMVRARATLVAVE